MNRTCKVCGLIFQTVTNKGFELCHNCFIAQLEKHFMLLIPNLFEMSDERLNDLLGLTCSMHACAKAERTRRDGYVSALVARIREN